MSAASGAFTAGAATIDITPQDLTALNPIGGTTFEGVHDRIALRALVVSDGTTEAALVAVDLIEVGDTVPARRRIAEELGLPAESVLIAASHSHNAPRFGTVSPGALAHDGGPESAAYTAWVTDRMIEALRSARAAAVPARVGTGTGTVDVNVNRDEYVDGRWVLGTDPDGPSDKTLRVVRVETADGDPIATVLNYAVHSTVALWSGLLSADLAGAAARHVEEELGGVALWTLGTVGDQAPRISLGAATTDAERDRRFAFRAVEAQGLLVGAEAVRVARGITRTSTRARVLARERIVPLPVKRGVDQMADMRQADVDTVELRLSLLALGPIAFAGVSGEVTTRIGRRLLRASPLAATILTSLVNDRIGYLPEDEAYDRATFEAKGSPVQQGSGERAIVEGLLELLDLVEP